MSDSPGSLLARLEPCTGWPVRRPKTTLLVLLILGLVFGAGLTRLGFDPTTEKVFPQGHEAVELYQAFREAFGGDEAVFLAFEVPAGRDVFTREALQLSRALSRAASEVEGVEQSFALADMPVLQLTAQGPRLAPGLPDDLAEAREQDLARFERAIERLPLVGRMLVSKDRRASMVAVALERLPEGTRGAELNVGIVSRLEGLVAEQRRAHPEVRFWLAGSPMIKARIVEAIQHDMVTFAPPLILIGMLVAGCMLRSVRGVALVLGVLGLANAFTLGAMGLLGVPLDAMTSLVPTLILVIGVADSLHMLVEQRAQVARQGPQASGAETIEAAARHVLVPCLLTSATTMIGFGSLVASPIPPIQRFGVAAALSAGATFLITMTFIPAVAALWRPPAPASAVQSRARGLAELVLRRPLLSLLGALGLCVALGLGWLKVEVYTDFLSFFPEQDPLVESVAAIESRFVGVAPCEVIVATPPGRSRDPRVLELTLALERLLEDSEMVDVCFSAADMVAEATRLMSGTRGIPPDAAGIARVEKVLRQVAGHEDGLQQLISPPGGVHPGEEWLRITVRARSVGSHRYGELSRLVREFSRVHFEPIGVRALPTGTSIVFSESAQAIVDGQIKSFFFAYVLITVVLSVFLRSLRLGLISAIPNVAPIAALLGVMGYLGIPFNSFNSMVASIALGIAVDDTIHVLAGFQRSARELPLREAVAATIGREGTALISTSAVLFCGFGFLLFATFVPTTEFGLLTAVAIAVALLGDLVILPALLVLCPWLTGVRGVQPEALGEDGAPQAGPALGGPPAPAEA